MHPALQIPRSLRRRLAAAIAVALIGVPALFGAATAAAGAPARPPMPPFAVLDGSPRLARIRRLVRRRTFPAWTPQWRRRTSDARRPRRGAASVRRAARAWHARGPPPGATSDRFTR